MKVMEFPGSDDYGLLPEPGKIAEIASAPAIGGRLAGTLEEMWPPGPQAAWIERDGTTLPSNSN